MFQWIYTNIWGNEIKQTVDFSGPARYAPNNGVNIKELIEARNNFILNSKLPLVIQTEEVEEIVTTLPPLIKKKEVEPSLSSFFVTKEDICFIKDKLKPVPIIERESVKESNPLFREFNSVFSMGNDAYFQKLKEKREKKMGI
jgi:hypothetical protein